MTQNAQNLALAGASAAAEKLESFLSPIVEGLGYEIVHLEVLSHRQKTICLYIDHLSPNDSPTSTKDEALEGSASKSMADEPIGIEDCAKVSRAVDEPLEMLSSGDATSGEAADSTLKALLASGFELEVSSPGIDRPLRKERDFKRFQGREIRITTFRPLSETELQNQEYFLRNPKQKNYLGELTDFQKGEILLKVSASMGSLKKELGAGNKPGAKKSANPITNKSLNKKLATKPEPKVDFVHIPLSLVSKANLEPQYDIVSDDDEISEESSKEKS